MEGDHIKIWHWLTPLSWLYGLGVGIRNILFECGLLRSESFNMPVISVGNITVGGTGKTPHTEYLIRLLSPTLQVAVLSRGYKRKSSGFRLADDNTPMREIGDEPYQMKHKYPNIHMAVDKNRRRGIKRLCDSSLQPPTDVVLLDDAYQHRYVTPGISILLMDYHRLIYFDKLLPAGRLREPKSSSQRADMVIVTKCPDYITPMEKHGIARSLGMQPWQRLYFTCFKYGKLTSLTDGTTIPLEALGSGQYKVILLSGIASPQQLEYDLEKFCQFEAIHFADHHNFTDKDLKKVKNKVDAISEPGKQTIIITTEKDAVRLRPLPNLPIYALPIEVQFMDDKTEDFNQYILSYVHKNSRNSILFKGKDADKA